MSGVLGLCFSDYGAADLPDNSFVGIRTMAAVHFLGRYRFVDFALSNFINAGIFNIGIIVNNQYQSLMAYIGSGKDWDLSRKGDGGITFHPMEGNTGGGKLPFFKDKTEAYDSLISYIRNSTSDYVVLAECNMLYNIDYKAVISKYERSNADIVAIYAKNTIDPTIAEHTFVYNMVNDRITGVTKRLNPNEDEIVNFSLNSFVIRRTTLLQMLMADIPHGMKRFSADVIAQFINQMNVIGYEYDGYSAYICSISTFFKHNMDMLISENKDKLFYHENRLITTKSADSRPTRYGSESKVSNSIIADGCQIDGTVENCAIFRNVHVMPGAVVRNCILQEGTIIENKAELNWIITDKNVIITENRVLMGYETHPVYIPEKKVV